MHIIYTHVPEHESSRGRIYIFEGGTLQAKTDLEPKFLHPLESTNALKNLSNAPQVTRQDAAPEGDG